MNRPRWSAKRRLAALRRGEAGRCGGRGRANVLDTDRYIATWRSASLGPAHQLQGKFSFSYLNLIRMLICVTSFNRLVSQFPRGTTRRTRGDNHDGKTH